MKQKDKHEIPRVKIKYFRLKPHFGMTIFARGESLYNECNTFSISFSSSIILD